MDITYDNDRCNAYYLITHHSTCSTKLCTPVSLIELKPYNKVYVRAQPTSTIIHSRYILVNFVIRLTPGKLIFPIPVPDPPFGAEGGMASLASM